MTTAQQMSAAPVPLPDPVRLMPGLRAPRNRWAVLLAGGDGTRLLPITRRLYGYDRPKQYCAFGPGGTLLEQTLRRAARLVDPDRIVVVVSRNHWREALQCLAGWPEVTIIDQPANRGTLPGILWPVLNIQAEDPDATVLVMPCDHAIGPPEEGEAAFAEVLEQAAGVVHRCPDELVLLGAESETVLDEVGWIVPGDPVLGAGMEVQSFHEKPSMDEASRLHQQGALVSTFIMAARAATLIELAREHRPDWWLALSASLEDHSFLPRLYDELAPAAFSHEVLTAAASRLRVLPMSGVEWSDIGTPERLLDALTLPFERGPTAPSASLTSGWRQHVRVVS